MPTKKESVKQAERESGTGRDAEMGKSAHKAIHMPNHEFGADRGGTDCHECHRGKS